MKEEIEAHVDWLEDIKIEHLVVVSKVIKALHKGMIPSFNQRGSMEASRRMLEEIHSMSKLTLKERKDTGG